jgi:prepilin-type N-terminal cleavage/methylation domain-containing protein
MMKRQRRRAFTLIEILLVMAVMVTVAAIGWPAIDSLYEGAKLESASDSVRAAWADAQAHAMSEGRPYRFCVVPGKGNYRFAPDSNDFWTGSTPAPDPENPCLVVEASLPRGIIFDGEAPPSSNDTSLPDTQVPSNMWAIRAIFLPDGSAQEDCDMTLRLAGCRPINLHLRALTGVTSIQRGQE